MSATADAGGGAPSNSYACGVADRDQPDPGQVQHRHGDVEVDRARRIAPSVVAGAVVTGGLGLAGAAGVTAVLTFGAATAVAVAVGGEWVRTVRRLAPGEVAVVDGVSAQLTSLERTRGRVGDDHGGPP